MDKDNSCAYSVSQNCLSSNVNKESLPANEIFNSLCAFILAVCGTDTAFFFDPHAFLSIRGLLVDQCGYCGSSNVRVADRFTHLLVEFPRPAGCC